MQAAARTRALAVRSGCTPNKLSSRHMVGCRAAGDGGEGGRQLPKPPRATKPPTHSSDKEGSPFYELGLKDIADGMGRTRVRQHVNPLATRFQRPTGQLDWSQVYTDPHLPLFVDMGCGPGRFLLLLCRHQDRQQQAMNYLGLEIRQPLVERANKWAQELGLRGRVHYEFTNVSISLRGLLSSYPGPVSALAAQFPDPHFKKRHKKRRMVQPAVVEVARSTLVPGGLVFLQSDVLEAVTSMRDEFEQHAGDVLQLSPLHAGPGRVFHWTQQQEVAAAAAAAAAAAEQHKTAGAAEEHGRQQGQSEQQLGDAQPSQPAPAAAAAAGDGDDRDGDKSESLGADASSNGPEEGDEEDADDGSNSSSGEGFVSSWAAGGWLVDNPLGVPTEREHYVQSQGGRVYRVLLVKREPAAAGA